jgi:enoyl-CoA hydratase
MTALQDQDLFHSSDKAGDQIMSQAPSAEAQAQQDILYEVRDGIATVTFNRPRARNAFTFAMYERLAEICAAADGDRTIRALILTGAGGKAFAAGTDISQFRAFDTPEDALGYEARIDRVLTALEQCRVPTIAAIAGACTGGGAAIASCCDLRIATAHAKFGLPIARTLGNCLSMSNYARFADMIGAARVKDLIFTARLVDAPEALAIGLVNEIVEDVDALMSRAQDLARTVAGHAPLTLQATKKALRRLRPTMPPGEGDDLILMCYMSRDFREGVDAFLNKRPPNFTGE